MRFCRFIAGAFTGLQLAFCLPVSLPGTEAAANKVSHRVVVMISVDGLAGYYLDDPKAEMPTIRALAAAGTRARLMKASTPTVTWPNHTTLVTGVNPARHGVVGNNYFDREAAKPVRLISDPLYDQDQIVKVPTIYDLAKEKRLKTAAVRWPATRNARSLDWTIPDMSPGKPMLIHTTPALLEACAKAGIPFGWAETNAATEVTYTRILNMILHDQRPQLALLHIIEVDHVEHLKGPRTPEAYAAIKDADDRVGEVWAELKRDFPDRATLFVVSDHGFSPIRRMLLPNVLLRQAGLLGTNGTIHTVGQGGAAMIYVLEKRHRKDLISQVRKALAGLNGISRILGAEDFKKYGVANPKDDPHAPDMILFAEEGCVFSDTADGDLPFIEKPERGGSHGHDPNLPDLHALFVGWGDGIKPGVKLGEISNVDVAPTIAKLLGFSIPHAEGKPLKAALAPFPE
jgi:predicted AlkP superfamily pyrophosphatase or phosphodiesterase